MKTQIISLSIMLILYSLLFFFVYESGNKDPKISLPEEYPLISTSSNKPDTLIAFYRNDTLYFQFIVAARNYPNSNH